MHRFTGVDAFATDRDRDLIRSSVQNDKQVKENGFLAALGMTYVAIVHVGFAAGKCHCEERSDVAIRPLSKALHLPIMLMIDLPPAPSSPRLPEA